MLHRSRTLACTCLLAAVLAIPACGGDDDGGDDDSGTTVDGGPDGGTGTADAAPADPDAIPGTDALAGRCLVEDSYSGELIDPSAFVGNSGGGVRLLTLAGRLPGTGLADRLVITKFEAAEPPGFPTGTFALPDGGWVVTLCADFRPGSIPACEQSIPAASGTLVIDEAEDRLIGSAADLVFAAEENQGCQSTIAAIQFDERIERPTTLQ